MMTRRRRWRRRASSPLDQLPDLRAHGAGLDIDVGVDARGEFELVHGFVCSARFVKEVGQIAMQRGLAMAIAPGATEREGRFSEGDGLLDLSARFVGKGQVVERGGTNPAVLQLFSQSQAALEVEARDFSLFTAVGENTKHIVCLSERTRIAGLLGQI